MLHLIAQASHLTALDFHPTVLDFKERRKNQRLHLLVLPDLQVDHLQMAVSQHGSKSLEATSFS
jgi:hypothetical protein